ncbi:hypothetical protein QC763_107580 [Podospora pseudopauciseta]|nr:hypothetical protein QC763_107580 [Podospora pseudopauciseta]KAK4681463.1 hypothetical protein QC764_107580 [Podospora pseudoanserina]
MPPLSPIVETHRPTSVPPSLLSLLYSKPYFPFSLPVLRRIQFAETFADRGGCTSHSRVVHVYHHPGTRDPDRFVTGYVDLSKGPETQVWLFCSLEIQSGGEEGRVWDGLLLRFFQVAEGLWEGGRKKKILVGSIHEMVRKRMINLGMGLEKTALAGGQEWEFDYKFVFRVGDLPELEGGMSDKTWEVEGREFYWDEVRKGDVGLVKSRTAIDRQEMCRATLLMVPSLAVRLGATGEAVGWGFLGLDGTLMSLHVEEPYRRLGFGKAIAIKLMRERLHEYGDDGLGAADVWVENTKSQGLCRAIGGKPSWIVSWGILDLESMQNIKL